MLVWGWRRIISLKGRKVYRMGASSLHVEIEISISSCLFGQHWCVRECVHTTSRKITIIHPYLVNALRLYEKTSHLLFPDGTSIPVSYISLIKLSQAFQTRGDQRRVVERVDACSYGGGDARSYTKGDVQKTRLSTEEASTRAAYVPLPTPADRTTEREKGNVQTHHIFS